MLPGHRVRKVLRRALVSFALASSALSGPAFAQIAKDAVRIGVLNDQSGPYADPQGPGSVASARLAIRDFGGKVLGKPVELLVGDHQNKADIGASIARRWIDVDGVGAIVDFGNSAVSLAVQDLAKNKAVIINVSSVTDRLFGDACSPTAFVWNYDSSTIANAIGRAAVKAGGNTWFLIVADYSFGQSLQQQIERVVVPAGGKIVGVARHPVATTDFSAYLLQAQASGAKVVAALNAGDNTINTIKQAGEFGLVEGGQKIAGTAFYITNVHALGLKTAQGLQFVVPFYWDQDDASRAFTRRWRAERGTDAAPSHLQAGVYSAVLAYLRAVEAAGTDDPVKVSEKLRELPVNDFYAQGAKVRADGRLMKGMTLYEVKTPAESKGPWDYLKPVRAMPADEIIRPLAESNCPYAKAN
ncbi:branched-chain amino acid transport system substrate-binding protein [Aquabacter spiritensis]|uniref:Branched-chain amino acid transport system substrate-binding protein n=1 Tax=Aquabacter spiritensis TaxID=933073 RepID=A0A4R3LKQ7_9HYPH|nr:branched-chain amino acid transport system substrate-binding protein [Aquabacter spiritensis]